MAKMIQVSHVPDRMHRELVRRAKARGQTLPRYAREILERELQRRPAGEVFERIGRRSAVDLGRPAAALIRGGVSEGRSPESHRRGCFRAGRVLSAHGGLRVDPTDGQRRPTLSKHSEHPPRPPSVKVRRPKSRGASGVTELGERTPPSCQVKFINRLTVSVLAGSGTRRRHRIGWVHEP